MIQERFRESGRKSLCERTEIFRQRVGHREFLILNRMLKADLRRVEKEPWQIKLFTKPTVDSTLSIGRVTDELRPEMGEVTPDLVAPSSFDSRFYGRKTSIGLEGLELAMRGLLGLRPVIGQRAIAGKGRWTLSSANSEVDFSGGRLAQLIVEEPRRL